MRSKKSSAFYDLVVALVSIPLLIMLGLIMANNLRGEWTADPETRWNVFGLGMALLCTSLLMCCYVTHRMGLCIWEAHNRLYERRRLAQANMASVSSQLQLVVSGDLPPSYDSIIRCDVPPPYCTLKVCEDKNNGVPLSEQPQIIIQNTNIPRVHESFRNNYNATSSYQNSASEIYKPNEPKRKTTQEATG